MSLFISDAFALATSTSQHGHADGSFSLVMIFPASS